MTLSLQALGDGLGMSKQGAAKHVARGMPRDSIEAAVAWHKANKNPAQTKRQPPPVDGVVRQANDESFEQARTRKEIALADKAEMDANQQRGQLIEAAAVKSELGRQFGAIREGLLNVAARVTPMLSLSGPQASLLDAEIRAVLAQYVGEA